MPAPPEPAPASDARGADVRLPPPLSFAMTILLAALFDRRWPWPISEGVWATALGWVLVAIAILLLGAATQQFRRHRTAVEPWKPTTTLMTDGLFAYSRNPVYVALVLLTVGLGFTGNNLWLALAGLPAALLVYWTAIRKEEHYLERKFGEDYRRYCQRVRRWL